MNQVQTESPAPVPSPSNSVPKTGFGRTFWILNSIEMWERLAYYNLRVMAPIYIMQADNPGGLHLTSTDKGIIYLWWSLVQSVLPTVTGGIADRFGYKRTMGCAIFTVMLGYLLIAFLRDVPFINNYWGFFLGVMVMAAGTAFFKPGLQGLLASNLPREKSSVGWGIFYWVVNIGAFIGHYLPAVLLGLSVFLPGILHAEANSPAAWRNLFVMSALFTSFNLLLLFVVRDSPTGASTTEPFGRVIWRTLTNVFEPRLCSWIIIMSGFWLMMYQLWDLHPNFITDWVDSSSLVERLCWLPTKAFLALTELQPRGRMIPQAVILSANSLLIICFVVLVSWLTRKMLTLSAMTIGMVMGIFGILVSGWTQNIYIVFLGIACFSLGEMMTSPKKLEYLSLIAPPGKKGLYLGYTNIPAGIGSGVGGVMAGYLYQNYGEKAVLALKYIATRTEWGQAKVWNGQVADLESALGVTRVQAMTKLTELTGLDSIAATNLLWDTYHPHYVWIPFALIGVVAAVALYIFGRMAARWKDMNA